MSIVELERASTSATDPDPIARQLVEQLRGGEPKLAMVFAPADRDHAGIARALKDKLPQHTRLVYATSGAPIGPTGSTQDAIVLAALTGDLEVTVGLGTGLSADPVSAGTSATATAADQAGVSVQDIDTRNTFGIVIDDGSRHKKEEFLVGVLDANPSLNLVGGGAGDGRPPGEDSATVVGIEGEVTKDAAAVVLIRTSAKWKIFRHHAYEPTGHTLRVNKVDDETYMQVLEINDQPAARAYADLLGVDPNDLEFGNPGGFSDWPTAMRVGREYFMCAPWKPLPDGSILFANRILPNTELELMRLVDFVPALKDFLANDLPKRVDKPTGALYFNCFGRYLMAQTMGIESAVDSAYANGPPAAGMNAVFETFNGFQVNSTLTAVAFGMGS